jgi:glycosyltransferase involved in cell wall biosynthesis
MSNNWKANGLSVIIPTYKRPDDIVRALKSVEAQIKAYPLAEIIIVDNDPKGSAREAVGTFIQQSSTTAIYIHEPNPGVSNARNTALMHARGRYLAFLDDDMEALPNWISASLKASENYKAGLVFGPVNAVMPQGKAIYAFMAPAFDRLPHSETGLIPEGVATGGCVLDLNLCQMPNPPFDTSLNETGGEDDALFRHVMSKGTKAVWTEDAKCLEHVPAKRATFSYIWRRNFAFGQSPSQEAMERGIKGLPRLSFWMAVGGVQALLALPNLLWTGIIRSPKRVTALAKLAQGVGKIFWQKPFSPKLYGN